jgi:peptidyl-prolyl cis-trans isomerase SurA
MLPRLARRVLALSVIVAVCAAGCRSTATAPPKAVAPDTWAVVDGHEIARDAVEKAYRRSKDPQQILSNEEALTAKLAVLDELIMQELLLAKAGDEKIELTNAEIDTAYADAKKNIPDDAFQQELSRRNVTAADMREGLRRELLSQKLIEKNVNAKVAPTDQEVTEFFNANRAQFNLAEDAYHIAQIVVTPVRDGQIANRSGDDATTPQAANAKAQMIMERLKAGASFSDLAMTYSEDPESAPRGGDLGFVPLSKLRQAPPALRDAVLKASPGTVNVVSANGAHSIVLLVAKETAGQRELSTPGVRERITETLRGRKEQLLRTAFLAALRSDAHVVNYAARRLVESNGNPQSVSAASAGAK